MGRVSAIGCLRIAPRRRTKHIYKSDSSCCFVRPSLINASNLVTATSTLRCGKYFTKCGWTNCTHRFSDVFSMQTGPYINDFPTRTIYFQLFWQSTHKFSNYTALLSNVEMIRAEGQPSPWLVRKSSHDSSDSISIFSHVFSRITSEFLTNQEGDNPSPLAMSIVPSER